MAGLGCGLWAQGLPELLPAAAPVVAPLPAAGAEMFGTSSTADPVGPGDVLEVEVFGQPQLSGSLQVGPEGAIAPPFLHRMAVSGRTPAAIQAMLQRAYAAMLQHPLVSVRLIENNSRRIAINGAVPRPGVYSFTGQLSLMEALGMAGGVDPVKASPVIMIWHAPPAESGVGRHGTPTYTVNDELETVDLRRLAADPSLNRMLQPGDVIEVPEAHQIYISGDVMRPGAEALTPGLTLTQLIGESGGLLPQADPDHVRVLRVDGSRRRVLVVNVAAAASKRGPDLTLEPDDLVEVPGSLLRQAGLELLDFFTGTARWRVQQTVANKLP